MAAMEEAYTEGLVPAVAVVVGAGVMTAEKTVMKAAKVGLKTKATMPCKTVR